MIWIYELSTHWFVPLKKWWLKCQSVSTLINNPCQNANKHIHHNMGIAIGVEFLHYCTILIFNNHNTKKNSVRCTICQFNTISSPLKCVFFSINFTSYLLLWICSIFFIICSMKKKQTNYQSSNQTKRKQKLFKIRLKLFALRMCVYAIAIRKSQNNRNKTYFNTHARSHAHTHTQF